MDGGRDARARPADGDVTDARRLGDDAIGRRIDVAAEGIDGDRAAIGRLGDLSVDADGGLGGRAADGVGVGDRHAQRVAGQGVVGVDARAAGGGDHVRAAGVVGGDDHLP